MFEKYNINDLFLASINVWYPDDIFDVNVGGILIADAGYGYLTILKKDNNEYIDLQNMSRKITTRRDPRTTSYIINYMEPLSKYYTQDGKKKATFSRRKAIKEANKHYDTVHQEHLAQMKERQKNYSF